METERRGRGRRPPEGPPPGTFRPALPTDSDRVVHLFAVAARAVCAEPTAIDAVTQVLEAFAPRLVEPERSAAAECGKMWQLFIRVARLPKDTLRLEAGRAFCRDLDALGQRLDLPPLPEWQDLPAGLDEPGFATLAPNAAATAPAEGRGAPLSLEVVKKSAQNFLAAGQGGVGAHESAQLLGALHSGERLALFDHMVGRGLLGRSDVNLLVRFLAKNEPVGQGDTMLIEVLQRLGTYLAKSA